MDILVNVLESGERYQTFNVDVAVELCRKIGVVWDDPSIINHNPVDVVFPAIVRSIIEWVALPINACVRLESLWEMFRTLPILETSITTAMNHTPLHGLEQHGFRLWIWPICPNRGVDVSGGENLLSVFEENQNVCMR